MKVASALEGLRLPLSANMPSIFLSDALGFIMVVMATSFCGILDNGNISLLVSGCQGNHLLSPVGPAVLGGNGFDVLWHYHTFYMYIYRILPINRTVQVEVGNIFCRRGVCNPSFYCTPQ